MYTKGRGAIILVVISILVVTACMKDRVSIGRHYQGGIVFYIDNSGKHGLIAAPYDQSNGIAWSNGNDTVRTTATGTAIGTGKANTKAIIDKLGPGSYAASICDQLVIGNFDDWYLPSADELNLLYEHKDIIGGFSDAWYWSSTDLLGTPAAGYAMNQNFLTGSTKFNSAMNKGERNPVRAVRSF